MEDSWSSPSSIEDVYVKRRLQDSHSTFHTKKRHFVVCLNLAGISVLLYIILLALKLDGRMPSSFIWSYTIIPFSIGILFICFSIFYFLQLDYWMILDPGKKLLQVSSTFLSACLICFLVLLNLKVDNILQISYWVVFAPLFILLGLALYILIFIFPGLVDQETGHFDEAFVLVINYVLFSVFVIIICLKLENALNWNNLQILIFPFAALVIDIVAALKEAMEKGLRKTFDKLLVILGVFIYLVLLLMALDGSLKVSWFLIFAPLFAILLVFEHQVISLFLHHNMKY